MARALAKVMPGSKQKHVSPAPPAADVGENVWDEMLALAAAEAASKELGFFLLRLGFPFEKDFVKHRWEYEFRKKPMQRNYTKEPSAPAPVTDTMKEADLESDLVVEALQLVLKRKRSR